MSAGSIALTWLATALLAAGCGGKKEDRGEEPAPGAQPPAARPHRPAPRPAADPRVEAITRCWARADAGDPAHAGCYTDDAAVAFVDAQPPLAATGGAGALALYGKFREGFPDLMHQLGLILVNGDQAVITFAAHGTNSGPLMGQPATGRTIGLLGAQHARLAGGKIRALDFYVDLQSMVGQLGTLPPDTPYRAAAQKGGQGQTRAVVAAGDDTETGNAATVARVEEALARSAVDEALGAFAADARFLYVPGPRDAAGTVKLGPELAAWRARTPATPAVVWTLPAGDHVAVGVQAGEVPRRELHLYRLAGGKVTELWIYGSNPETPRSRRGPRRAAP